MIVWGGKISGGKKGGIECIKIINYKIHGGRACKNTKAKSNKVCSLSVRRLNSEEHVNSAKYFRGIFLSNYHCFLRTTGYRKGKKARISKRVLSQRVSTERRDGRKFLIRSLARKSLERLFRFTRDDAVAAATTSFNYLRKHRPAVS